MASSSGPINRVAEKEAGAALVTTAPGTDAASAIASQVSQVSLIMSICADLSERRSIPKTQKHTHSHTRAHTPTTTYTQTRAHAHTHTHTHTHTHAATQKSRHMQAATLDRRRRKATLPTRLGDPSTPFSKSSAGIKTKTEDQNNKKRHRTTQTETELPIRKRSRPLDTPLFYVPNPVTDAVVGSVARRLMEIDSLVCVCVSVCVWLCGREDAIGLRRQRRSVDARRRAYRTVWATC